MASSNDPNKNKGFDDIKSLLLGGAVLGPIAIGLGLGIKGGFTTVASNKGSLTPTTHLDSSNLIGRNIAKNSSSMIRDSFAASRASLKKRMATNAGDFAKMARTGGPQRVALVNALRAMLNSPNLELTDTYKAQFMNEIVANAAGPAEQFETFMKGRIERLQTEFGPSRTEEFNETLRRETKRQMRLGESLVEATAPSLEELPGDIKFRQVNLGEIMAGRLGGDLKARTTALQQLLVSEGFGGAFKIHAVTSSKYGTSYMARLKVNQAEIDLPLGLARGMPGTAFGELAKGNAPGGVAFQWGRSMRGYATPRMMTGSMTGVSGGIVSGEERAFGILQKLLPQLKGLNPIEAREWEKQFITATYDTGIPMKTITNPGKDYEAITRGFSVSNIPGLIPGERLSESRMAANPLVKAVGASPDFLAKGFRLVSNAPTSEVLSTIGSPDRNELGYAQRQMHRDITIMKSNKRILNDYWTENSVIGRDMNNAINQMMGGNSIPGLIVMEPEKWIDASGQMVDNPTFMARRNIQEGSFLGNTRGFATSTTWKNIYLEHASYGDKKMPAILAHILKERNAATMEQDIWISRKQLKQWRKNKQLALGISGMTGLPVDMPLDEEITGIRITGIQGAAGGTAHIHGQVAYKAGPYSKYHSYSLKGHALQATKGVLEEEARTILGDKAFQEALGGGSMRNVQIATDKQLAKAVSNFRHQIYGAGMHLMARAGVNQAAAETIINPLASHTDIGKGAAGLVRALHATGKYSSETIAATVRGVWLHNEAARADIEAAFGPNGRATMMAEKGILSAENIAMAKPIELQGGGKPGAVERRTIAGFYNQFRAMGLSARESESMLGDIVKRSGGMGPKRLLAMTGFMASTFNQRGGNLPGFRKFLGDVGETYKETAFSVSNLRGGATNIWDTDAYKAAHLVKFTFDTPETEAAARAAGFGKEIYLPGGQVTAGLEGVVSKGKDSLINITSEYDQGLHSLMRTLGQQTAAPDTIESAIRNYGRSTAAVAVELSQQMVYTKIAGSTQAGALGLSRGTIGVSDKAYDAMQRIAKKDAYQTMFLTDEAFMGAATSMDEHIRRSVGRSTPEGAKLQQQLLSRVKGYYFKSGVGQQGVDMFALRNPTLGAGHTRMATVRRFGTAAANQNLLKKMGTRGRTIIGEALGVTGRVGMREVSTFLRGKGVNTEMKDRFARHMINVAKSTKFAGGGAGTRVYLPTMEQEITFGNGNQTFRRRINRFGQMVGDTDGDTISLMFSFKSNLSAKLRAANPENFLLEEMEFEGLKQYARASAQAGGVAPDYLEKTLKEVRGKRVGAFSNAMDEFRIGMMTADYSPQNRQALMALSFMEEFSLIKARKANITTDIGKQFVEALTANQGRGNKEAARDVLAQTGLTRGFRLDLTMKGDSAENVEALKTFMGSQYAPNRTLSSTFDFDQLWDYMWDIRQSAQASGAFEARSLKQTVNRIREKGYDAYADRLVQNLQEGQHGFVQGAGAEVMSIGHANSGLEGIVGATDRAEAAMGKAKGFLSARGFAIPAAIGAAVGLAALGLAAPGYSTNPLPADDQMMSPSMRSSVQSGHLLGGITDALASARLMPDSYPTINPSTMIENETIMGRDGQGPGYGSEQPGRIESTINDISNLGPIKKIMSAANLSRSNIYIQDNRRPILEADLDRHRED